ncbi:MAG: hypothetical protein RRA15_01460 [bacterium]|nr:hypothetical protein [bacterium]MDT8365146.1 hypothetical protein [bacterium]
MWRVTFEYLIGFLQMRDALMSLTKQPGCENQVILAGYQRGEPPFYQAAPRHTGVYSISSLIF